MNRVIFACVHNAGRSQMAAAFFNRMTDPQKARAISAGTQPGERVHPEVVTVMREAGVDLAAVRPQKLTAELAQGAHTLVTMGCGDECPVVPGTRRADWPLTDPRGKPLDEVRRIRDEIRARVRALLLAEGWLGSNEAVFGLPELAVFIATSLDGFIARPGGGLDWLEPFHGEEHGYAGFFAGVDALVIGRGTYDTVLAFPQWPYGEKRVIVCTARPVTPRRREEFWTGSPRELASRLGAEGVRRVYLDGGALIRSFLREGLVSELCINLIPLVLGSGIPLFASGLPEVRLRLVEAKTYPSGLVQLRYQREGTGSTVQS